MESEEVHPQKQCVYGQPQLLRMPLSLLSNVDETSSQRQIKLLKFTKPKSLERPKCLFRLPQSAKENKEPVLIQHESVQKPIPQPKLIDLRPIFKFKTEEKTAQVIDKASVPKLIRLPDIHTESQQKKLLESPKREKPRKKRSKPKCPKVLDFRDESISQTISKKDVNKVNEIAKQASPRRHVTSPPVLISPPPPPMQKFVSPRRRESPHYHHQHIQHQSREDQLFDIINELLQEKRSKRKTNRRIRLFDVIDNIPITSPGSDSDTESIKHRRKKKASRRPDDDITQSLVNYGLTGLPSPKIGSIYDKMKETNHTFAPFPGPVHDAQRPGKKAKDPSHSLVNFINPAHKIGSTLDKNETAPFSESVHATQKVGKNVKDPSDSWVNLINSIDRNIPGDDIDENVGDSWRHLKQLTRLENKETQTLKTDHASRLHTKEVQTEIKQMLEIPRTQTFFAEEKRQGKETEEFCSRVREEVIRKLEYQEKLEDKLVQTISHAQVQTDAIDDFEDHSFEEKETLPTKRVKEQQSGSPVPQTPPPPPPSIYYGLTLETHGKDGKDKSGDFIHVTNIDQSEPPKQYTPPPVKLLADTKKLPIISDGALLDEKNDSQNITFSPRRALLSPPKRSPFQSDNPGKRRLLENVDDFTQGIQALEDLQENIQRELRSTRMLFNTVEILQDGFDENPTAHFDEIPTAHLEEDTNLEEYGDNKKDVVLNTNSLLEGNSTGDNFIDDNHNSSLEEIGTKELIELAGNITDSELSKTRESIPSRSRNRLQMTSQVMEDTTILTNENHLWLYDTKSPQNGSQIKERARMRPGFAMSSLIEDLEEEEEARDQYESIEDAEKRKLLDEQKKGEIRKRLHITSMEEKERKEKLQEMAKREKLRTWMKDRKQLQRERYLEELEEKRGNEYRRFKSKTTYTRRQIDKNITLNEETKRANLSEDNRHRLEAAENLAHQIINERNSDQSQSKKTRRTSINDRYKALPGKIPVIRDTRSSRMRKYALIADVMRHDRKQLRQKTSKVKSTPPNRKPRKKANKNQSLDASQILSQISAFDQSFEIVNSGVGSPRVSVHPDEFVTGQSFERYWNRRSPLKTFDVTSLKKQVDSSIAEPLSRPSFNAKPRRADNNHLKDILTSYGLDIDNSLFLEKSETSNLLDEVDLALIEEGATINSTLTTNQSVDWNEIDRILNE